MVSQGTRSADIELRVYSTTPDHFACQLFRCVACYCRSATCKYNPFVQKRSEISDIRIFGPPEGGIFEFSTANGPHPTWRWRSFMNYCNRDCGSSASYSTTYCNRFRYRRGHNW